MYRDNSKGDNVSNFKDIVKPFKEEGIEFFNNEASKTFKEEGIEFFNNEASKTFKEEGIEFFNNETSESFILEPIRFLDNKTDEPFTLEPIKFLGEENSEQPHGNIQEKHNILTDNFIGKTEEVMDNNYYDVDTEFGKFNGADEQVTCYEDKGCYSYGENNEKYVEESNYREDEIEDSILKKDINKNEEKTELCKVNRDTSIENAPEVSINSSFQQINDIVRVNKEESRIKELEEELITNKLESRIEKSINNALNNKLIEREKNGKVVARDERRNLYNIKWIGTSFMIEKVDEDGKVSYYNFIDNIGEGCNVVRLYDDRGKRIKNYYLLQLGAYIFPIDYSKFSGKYMYNMILEKGLDINEFLTDKMIEKLLYKFVAPIIANTKTEYAFPVRAGWYQRHYYSADDFQAYNQLNDVNLPVREKRLSISQKNMCDVYLDNINRIKDREYRTILFLYPHIACLLSLYNKKNISFNKCINIVNCDGIRRSCFYNWLEILNRNCEKNRSLYSSKKEVEKLFKDSYDEVIVFNIEDINNEGIKGTEMKKALMIAASIAGKGSVYGVEPKSMVAFVSRQAIISRNVINLYINKDVYSYVGDEALDDFGSVFSEFIRYVEANYMECINTICRKGESDVQDIINSIFIIIEKFYRTKGYDIFEKLDIERDFSIDKIFGIDGCFEEDELVEKFVHDLRKVASKLKVVNENVKGFIDGEYFIDNDDHIFITREVLDKAFAISGLEKVKYNILGQLRENKDLITENNDCFTIKKQYNGQRKKMYKFKKSLLNKRTWVPIENLAERVD